MTISNDEVAGSPSGNPSKCPAITRWPVEETGRYSVRPSTMPSRIATERGMENRKRSSLSSPPGGATVARDRSDRVDARDSRRGCGLRIGAKDLMVDVELRAQRQHVSGDPIERGRHRARGFEKARDALVERFGQKETRRPALENRGRAHDRPADGARDLVPHRHRHEPTQRGAQRTQSK